MVSDGPTDATTVGGRRSVLVTGGAKGLGLGIARAFVADGCAVTLADVDASVHDTARALVAEGAEVWSCAGDVARRSDVARFVDEAVARHGRLDVLVNNAQGGGGLVPFLDTSDEHFELTWRSGVMGTFVAMQLAHPHLRQTHGCVINLVSAAALTAPAGYAAYAATKSAIRSLTHVAALEWGHDGVRVNAISPSARTPALDAWADAHPSEYAERASRIPLGRFGDPERDIGAVAVFLAGPSASYITGQTIVVDGGAHHL